MCVSANAKKATLVQQEKADVMLNREYPHYLGTSVAVLGVGTGKVGSSERCRVSTRLSLTIADLLLRPTVNRGHGLGCKNDL